MITQKVYNECHYSDLEEIIEKEYALKKGWRIFDDWKFERANNGTYIVLDPYGFDDEEVSKNIDEQIAIMLTTGEACDLEEFILPDLIRRGIIPSGNYLVEVYW